MQIRWRSKFIFEIPVYSSFIDAIELALIIIEVRLPQRPSLSQREPLEAISNF